MIDHRNHPTTEIDGFGALRTVKDDMQRVEVFVVLAPHQQFDARETVAAVVFILFKVDGDVDAVVPVADFIDFCSDVHLARCSGRVGVRTLWRLAHANVGGDVFDRQPRVFIPSMVYTTGP